MSNLLTILPIRKIKNWTKKKKYAIFLSSDITHDEFTKENPTKTFASEKCIETNNKFAIKGKKTLPISLPAWKQETQSCQN